MSPQAAIDESGRGNDDGINYVFRVKGENSS